MESLSKEECRQLREKHVGESLNCHMWYRHDPLRIVRASGQYMFDENGTRYLDCINNVSHVGHCHPGVVQAGIKQMPVLNTNHRFLYDELPTYAKRLVATMPEKLTACFLVNSGSEANDLAIRLARKVTKRFDLAVLNNAYHGQTFVLNELRPKDRRDNKEDIPHVHMIPSPDVYRGKYRNCDYTEEELAEKYAGEVEETFKRAHEQGRDIAGFLIESIQCVGGQLVPPKGFLTKAYNITKKYGALFIADEVQSGFGRIGEHWWAFQIDGEGVTPDIVTMGKPMGNGHPVAGLVTTQEIGGALSEGRAYFTTFGGNPVSCAIGLAVMDAIEKEKLMEHATTLGAYFKGRLQDLQKKQPIIGDIRGMGLMVGVDLVKDQTTREPATEEAKQIVNRLYEEKIIFSRDGEHENVLKFKPPMCITQEDIDYIINKFDMIFSEITSSWTN
ncbi:ethanolamine-phosphate phospho-lyase-like isoform X1 [Lineus longissimus]|uniref:ethanolamine-phosphate phospho-lyase-like isoform X1 n=1 Tax=Lineus longissimus TaxID=88925 RepID=UPI002B4C5989